MRLSESEVRQRLEPQIGGGERRSLEHSIGTLANDNRYAASYVTFDKRGL